MKSLKLAVLILLLSSSAAYAQSIYSFDLTNFNISGYTGPYANVTISLTSQHQATVTFTGLAGTNTSNNSSVYYLLHATNIADLNINSIYLPNVTVSSFSPNSIRNKGSGDVRQFGNFNMTTGNYTGFTNTVSFVLTDNVDVWTNAKNILMGNSNLWLAAAHIGVCSDSTCSQGATTTGYIAGDGNSLAVPEPRTYLLLGSALVGIFGLSKIKKQKARQILEFNDYRRI